MLLQSDSLELRAIELSDGSAILDILNTPAVTECLFGFPSKTQSLAFEDWLAAAANRKNDFYFAVTDRLSSEVVGVCAYQDIDYRNGRVAIWAAMQAPKDKTRLLALLASYAFMHLRMEHVALACLPGDSDTITAAESAGFTRDAIFYSRVKKSGKSDDLLIYTLLKGEGGDTQ